MNTSKLLLAACVSLCGAYAQTAVYPSAIVTQNQLKLAVNGVATLLTANINATQTTFAISACARVVTNVLITIDKEIMPVTGCTGTIMVVGSRGFDGTTPATHAAGATIYANVDAWHHNAVSAEVEAIETTLGTNLSNVTGRGSGNSTFCQDATGSTTTYACPAPMPVITSLEGLIVTFVPQTTNTGTSTLNVSGLGGKILAGSNCSTPVGAGSLVAGTAYLFSYNGTLFCQSTSSGGGVFPSGQQTQYLQVQPNTGNASTYRFNSLPTLQSSDYSFPSQTPGGSISPGPNTITVMPVPLGVNGTDTGHYYYVSGGTGTAEACLGSGGTAVSGSASGTLIIQCLNAHSGAWTIQPANFGVQEAINALPGGKGKVVMPAGTMTDYGPVYAPLDVAVSGSSIYSTVINIASTFPTAASGVFVGPGNTTEDGPQFSDFTLAFIQPDSTNIASYTHWPPAFYMVSTARFTIRNVQVTSAWDVVNMTGNSGGSIIENLQASMFNKGIWIDGSFDSVYLTGVRFWPYTLTTNQQTVMFTNPTTYGLYSGRMDDLHVTDFFADCTHGIYTFAGGLGATAGAMENIWIDTNADVTFGGGAQMRISNMNLSYLRMGSATPFTVTGDGTNVQLTNGFFFPGSMQTGSNPWVSVGSTALLQITNSWFWTAAVDVSHIVSSGTLIAEDNWFSRQNDLSYTTPIISILAGRATVIGNRTLDKGTGSGTFISVTTDNWHQIRANNAPGYLFSFPTSPGIGGLFGGVYENDGSYSAVTCMGMVCWGSGDPNGVLTKSPGNIFLSEAGGSGTTGYIKETGSNTNTGWTPIAGVGTSSIPFLSGGTPVSGSPATGGINIVAGSGVTCTPTVVSTVATLQCSADVAYLSTQLGINAVNAQTGTTYTLLSSDKAKVVTLCNAAAIAMTLPHAVSSFAAPFSFAVRVPSNCAGTATLTPATSTIDNGQASIAVAPGASVRIVVDGSGNYQLY